MSYEHVFESMGAKILRVSDNVYVAEMDRPSGIYKVIIQKPGEMRMQMMRISFEVKSKAIRHPLTIFSLLASMATAPVFGRMVINGSPRDPSTCHVVFEYMAGDGMPDDVAKEVLEGFVDDTADVMSKIRAGLSLSSDSNVPVLIANPESFNALTNALGLSIGEGDDGGEDTDTASVVLQ